ncbi:2-oxoglutarate dehydrogenase E1 component [Acidocella sp.]|uniref:2-oxoglutarate dehydrogenase E1 component n=1 Tax=Acidocella sp. TaxID=50710 RepID=UPI003CFBE8BD
MAGVDVIATAMNGANAQFIAQLYAKWVEAPGSVDPDFAALFAALDDDTRAIFTDATGASWAPRPSVFETVSAEAAPKQAKAAVAAPAETRAATLDSIRALMMIRAYRVRGHLDAQLDPLGLKGRAYHSELDPASYGFTEPADMDRPIFLDGVLGFETATLKDVMAALRKSYCGEIGVEFMHIQDPAQKSWIQRRVEGAPWLTAYDKKGKTRILKQLTEADSFETFCQKRFVGTKRFGLEGGESTIPALHAIIEVAAGKGVREIAIGMPHRGRLNTLVNIVKKPLVALFSEFGGGSFKPDDVQGSGDVKYHLGTSTDLVINGNQLHLSLQPNPSHLEAVDPVVVGKIRARLDMVGDTTRKSAMAIQMHGDAAFAGQGLVYETLAMSQLIGYRTGGSIHLVVNNQIGFTTVPAHAFSGMYCTDVAKSVQAPILHVNGDNPEAVVFAAQLAAEFRCEFSTDVVIDLVCYRRHGHNENDEPAFTQPIMYKAIKALKTTRALYADKLAKEGSVSAAEAKALTDEYGKELEAAYEGAKDYKVNKADWLEGHWAGLKQAGADAEQQDGVTAAPLAQLREVGKALYTPPQNFDLNPKIARQLDAKKQMFESGEGLDWATGEALAFGTLQLDGHRVRLSGEDVQRGTFSQRHAVLVDQTNQNEYLPLNNIADTQARIEIFNSLLSEAGVLGFEYGYTVADPSTLVLWEAQFGDFANGAQVIIDQFIAAGETKWLRMSGLVMLLPHGQEGQGPEHSSARLERYLQLCAENNIIVGNISTPANYYHALRRQMKRNYRKPLILMTPKSLLRHKLCVSPLADFAEGTSFKFVIPETDELVAPGKVKRVVICSGKVYYDLLAERRERGIKDVAIVRLEQFYPFPAKALKAAIEGYKNAEIVWCQEEPENNGGWNFVDRRIETALGCLGNEAKRPRYVGRKAAASPASGLAKTFAAEQAALVNEALTV